VQDPSIAGVQATLFMCKTRAFTLLSYVVIFQWNLRMDAVRSPDDKAESFTLSAPGLIQLTEANETDGSVWEAFEEIITEKGMKQKMEANATGTEALSIWSKLLHDPAVSDKCDAVGLDNILRTLSKDPSQFDKYLSDGAMKELDELMLKTLSSGDLKTLQEYTAKITGGKVTTEPGPSESRNGLQIKLAGFPEHDVKDTSIVFMNGVYKEDVSSDGSKCLNGYPTYWQDEKSRRRAFLFFCHLSNSWLVGLSEEWDKMAAGRCVAFAYFVEGKIDQRDPFLRVSKVKVGHNSTTWATNGTADANCESPHGMECYTDEWVKGVGITSLEPMDSVQPFDCSKK
jgi:hypothetical protein